MSSSDLVGFGRCWSSVDLIGSGLRLGVYRPDPSNLFTFNHDSIKNNRCKNMTTMSVDHLATTTSTGASRRRATIIVPPTPEPGKPCCSTHQSKKSSPMKKVVDQKGQTCKNPNKDRIQTDPPKTSTDRIPQDPMETNLHTPSDDAKRTIETRIEHGRHYSY